MPYGLKLPIQKSYPASHPLTLTIMGRSVPALQIASCKSRQILLIPCSKWSQRHWRVNTNKDKTRFNNEVFQGLKKLTFH
jgi:hypothetical protein